MFIGHFSIGLAAKNNIGKYGFWSMIVFLVLIHGSNLLGPPPPDTTVIAWVGEMQWLIVIWAYWADRNRIIYPAVR